MTYTPPTAVTAWAITIASLITIVGAIYTVWHSRMIEREANRPLG